MTAEKDVQVARNGGRGGGEVIWAMPERKHSFFQEVFPDCCSPALATAITIKLVLIRSSSFILEGTTCVEKVKSTFQKQELTMCVTPKVTICLNLTHTLPDRLRVTRRPSL